MTIRKEFLLESLSPPISHYCDAVRWGDLLFVSGVPPLDAKGNVVGVDDPAEQARQIFRNMQEILDAAGAKAADVLKVTVYLTDVNDRRKINPVRQQFFGDARPAPNRNAAKATSIASTSPTQPSRDALMPRCKRAAGKRAGSSMARPSPPWATTISRNLAKAAPLCTTSSKRPRAEASSGAAPASTSMWAPSA